MLSLIGFEGMNLSF